MMREEFEQRTGFLPSQSLYSIIEKYYMNFDGDKDAFCKAYKKNADGIATMIQHEADMQEVNAQIAAEKAAKEYEARIAELEKALEREQEWNPAWSMRWDPKCTATTSENAVPSHGGPPWAS